MHDVEEELLRPTGVATTPVPMMNINGVLISRECAIVLEIKNTEGMRYVCY
jgi:transmembrane E3 ubiquitin-protein ligase